MTLPETCGAAGGAISLWVNVLDFTASGVLSTYNGDGDGFVAFLTPTSLRYSILLTDVI